MWSTELIEMVRALIFDLSDSPDFTDSDLLRMIVVAAHFVNREADFSQDFAVDISQQDITPDPSAVATKDADFLNLTALKVACMLNIAQSRIDNKNAVLIKDDKNTYDFRDVAANCLELIKAEGGYCNMYDRAMQQFQLNHTASYAEFVMGPFRTIGAGYGRIHFLDG